jgi:hypothetical protein
MQTIRLQEMSDNRKQPVVKSAVMSRRSSESSSHAGEAVQVRAEWPDDEAWLTILEPAMKEDPGSAETAAHIFNYLIEMIGSGPDGIKAAVSTLEHAIRLSYGFTEASRLAFEHYRLHIASGRFHPDDEPESLLSGAIERCRKTITAEPRSKRKAAC